jgi:hypothetical protein
MRPKKPEMTGSGDLFRARLDQIANLKRELAQGAGKTDWDFIDGEIAPLDNDKGWPGLPTQFAIGLLLLKKTTDCSTKACASAGAVTLPVLHGGFPTRALGSEPLEKAARRQAGTVVG